MSCGLTGCVSWPLREHRWAASRGVSNDGQISSSITLGISKSLIETGQTHLRKVAPLLDILGTRNIMKSTRTTTLFVLTVTQFGLITSYHSKTKAAFSFLKIVFSDKKKNVVILIRSAKRIREWSKNGKRHGSQNSINQITYRRFSRLPQTRHYLQVSRTDAKLVLWLRFPINFQRHFHSPHERWSVRSLEGRSGWLRQIHVPEDRCHCRFGCSRISLRFSSGRWVGHLICAGAKAWKITRPMHFSRVLPGIRNWRIWDASE